MSQDPLTQLQIADLSIKVPVQVTYGLDSAGETRVKSVSVVHGPLSLDITALLTEDDFFDIFEQLDNWYIPATPDFGDRHD
jgi:hypothetical protein